MTDSLLDLLPGEGKAPAGAAAAGIVRPPTESQPTVEPRIIGLDLSIRATGIAGKGWTEVIKPAGNDYARMAAIRAAIRDFTRSCDLVVVEGLAYDAHDTKRLNAGLWWLITFDLTARDVPFAVLTTGGRAKYATGKGNAPKDAVLAATIRRFPGYEIDDNNIADALILAAAGYDHYGHPLAVMPETHRAALAAVDWPALAVT